jgi:hypothetical protein
MKSGFFLSGTAHGLVISFLVANGVFFMPERQYENLKKLDILVLSEAEFDAISSSPPSIENHKINEYKEPKNLSLNLGFKNSLSEIQESVNKHNLNKLNPINSKKDLIKELEPPIDFIPETTPILEKEINKKEQLDVKINKLGNEINSVDTPTLDKPKSREADRVDRIASDNKNSQKISDDLVALKKENSENLEINEKDKQKDPSKESTTKISPDAKKNVDIVSGVVETASMPLQRSFSETKTTSELDENKKENLQNEVEQVDFNDNEIIDQLVKKVNNGETSISTMEKIKLRKSINQLIGKYWNKGILIGGSDFENYVVKVEILLDTEGNIIGDIRPISPSVPFGRYAIAFREASNAIKAVGKIPIPSEKYKKGLKLKLTFDPALGIGFD